MQTLLNEVRRKGKTARFTPVGGWGSADPTECITEEIPGLTIKYQSKEKNCVPFALLNLQGASRRQKRRVTKALKIELCGLRQLATVSHLLRVTLSPCAGDLAWILRQVEGRFLLYQGVHCVGVDCDQRHLFDCQRSKVLRLTDRSLTQSDFIHEQEIEIRQVVHGSTCERLDRHMKSLPEFCVYV